MFLFKLKFSYSYLTIEDFNIYLWRLQNYRFVLVPSSNRNDYSFYTVCTIRLLNSLHSNITSAFNLFRFRRLLSWINVVSYLLWHT